jgi:hypothetical protein
MSRKEITMLEDVFAELDNCDVAAQRLINRLNGKVQGAPIERAKQAQQGFRDIRSSLIDAVARQTAGTVSTATAAVPTSNKPGSPTQPGLAAVTTESGHREAEETSVEQIPAGRVAKMKKDVQEFEDANKTLERGDLGGLGAGADQGIQGGGASDQEGVRTNKDGSIDKRTVKGPDRRMGEKVGDVG